MKGKGSRVQLIAAPHATTGTAHARTHHPHLDTTHHSSTQSHTRGRTGREHGKEDVEDGEAVVVVEDGRDELAENAQDRLQELHVHNFCACRKQSKQAGKWAGERVTCR